MDLYAPYRSLLNSIVALRHFNAKERYIYKLYYCILLFVHIIGYYIHYYFHIYYFQHNSDGMNEFSFSAMSRMTPAQEMTALQLSVNFSSQMETLNSRKM